jgi:hypothetical protein
MESRLQTDVRKPEACPICGQTAMLMEITYLIGITITTEGIKGGSISHSEKMCNACFMQKVWYKQNAAVSS